MQSWIDGELLAMSKFEIRSSSATDVESILAIHAQAFNNTKEPGLVRDLLGDPTALPLISLIAEQAGEPVGHILLTTSSLITRTDRLHVLLLAPLAVVPTAQGVGVGRALVAEGLSTAQELDYQLVFVLGHPDYYPRCGFTPNAQDRGFEPPFPLAEKDASAWMVAALDGFSIDGFQGRLQCAEALNRPEYWRE
jgi:Predicted acetyltransferase